MEKQFPRTEVGGISLPRMIMGTNWILGYSHSTAAASRMIKRANSNVKAVSDIACAYLENGIDAVMLPVNEDEQTETFMRGIRDAEDKMGQRIIKILTPVLNMKNSPEARREAEHTVKFSKSLGGDFLLIHHMAAEQLVNKNEEAMPRLPDYTAMIRDQGMIPGLSAHMPELIVYSDANGYDVETYVQIYNPLGFLMQVEVELIHNVIWNAKKPVITIKSMAAGRTTPFIGLTFSYCTIREQDMVAVGAFSRDEVYEDVEIALAALERRKPDVEGRPSPARTSIIRD